MYGNSFPYSHVTPVKPRFLILLIKVGKIVLAFDNQKGWLNMKKKFMGYNQEAAIEFGLDVVDLCILRVIEDNSWCYISSKSTSKYVRAFQIPYYTIMNELTILRLHDWEILARVEKLVKAGILTVLERHVYQFTNKMDMLK